MLILASHDRTLTPAGCLPAVLFCCPGLTAPAFCADDNDIDAGLAHTSASLAQLARLTSMSLGGFHRNQRQIPLGEYYAFLRCWCLSSSRSCGLKDKRYKAPEVTTRRQEPCRFLGWAFFPAILLEKPADV